MSPVGPGLRDLGSQSPAALSLHPTGANLPWHHRPQVALLDFGATREFDRSFTDLYIQVEGRRGAGLLVLFWGLEGGWTPVLMSVCPWCLVTVDVAAPSGAEGSKSHSVVSDFVTPWTVAPQAPLSMGFSGQEY